MLNFEKVVLHIGVHKTATTYIQNKLLQNIQLLNENGYCYIPLATMRKKNGFSSAIRNEKVTDIAHIKEILNNQINTQIDRTIAKSIDVNMTELKTLIISDENMLGGAVEFFENEALYPLTEMRLTKLKKVFEGKEITVVLSLREYAGFYASLYCEFLRNAKRFVTFRNYVSKFDYLNYSWQKITNPLNKIFSDNDVQILVFEDFRENEDNFFKLFVGDLSTDLVKYVNKSLRKSYHNETIRLMEILDKKLNSTYVMQYISFVEQGVLHSGRTSKFNPWIMSEKKHLQKKYAKDIKEIFKD